MLCPACKSSENKVIDSRMTEGGAVVRRRRQCLGCERRFTTKERIEEELRLTVIKVGGQRVPYNRENVISGVERACYKLEVTEDKVQTLVDRVEEELFKNHSRDVSTEQIGRYVGHELRHLDQVAYVRFMSVHRKYDNVEEFIDEIREVRNHLAQELPTQKSLFES